MMQKNDTIVQINFMFLIELCFKAQLKIIETIRSKNRADAQTKTLDYGPPQYRYKHHDARVSNTFN